MSATVTVPATYDVDAASREIHRVVIALVESVDEPQFHWRPEGYATSIAFHAWHLARESDFLRAAILARAGDQLGPEFGSKTEIWVSEGLLERWGFPPEIGTAVGTGLTDEVASTLPIPDRAEVLGYLRRSYDELEAFVRRVDERYPDAEGLEEEFGLRIGRIRLNVLNFLTHDCRHLGMMEVLKGLQTGFGSATESR
ncbi:MAG TPA: DinB family protein [Candidatus Limnocylindrales bacterium]|nr:DinB family protein [Candidatus Limnocylindrales bacterium]